MLNYILKFSNQMTMGNVAYYILSSWRFIVYVISPAIKKRKILLNFV